MLAETGGKMKKIDISQSRNVFGGATHYQTYEVYGLSKSTPNSYTAVWYNRKPCIFKGTMKYYATMYPAKGYSGRCKCVI